MDPWAAGLQALGILRGGGQPPTASSSSDGNFAYQTMLTGMPGWNVNLGGDGPPQAQAFTQSRPDSLVMGLTGISTATNRAAGNGISVAQPSVATGNWTALALVGALGFGLAYFLKGRK